MGHIDEIGLIVTHIDDDGFLWFDQIGGWDPQILIGQRVDVITRGGIIPGVAGRKPIHLLDADERKKVPKLKELHIDIGAKDGDEARSHGARRRRRGARRASRWCCPTGASCRARWTTASAVSSPTRRCGCSPRATRLPATSTPWRSTTRRPTSAAPPRRRSR